LTNFHNLFTDTLSSKSADYSYRYSNHTSNLVNIGTGIQQLTIIFYTAVFN